MDRREVARGIIQSWRLANNLSIAQSFSANHPLGVNEEFRNIMFSADSNYIELYLAGCRLRHYNFILTDFSFFQFSSDGEAARYAYFPNPFSITSEDIEGGIDSFLVEEEFSNEDYFEILAERPIELGKPAIRFEYAPEQYREVKHPCSHMHIGFHSENRWAVSRVLTPLAFTYLIIKHYYSEAWSKFDDGGEFNNELDRSLAGEKQNCRILGEEYFSDYEKRIFYFS